MKRFEIDTPDLLDFVLSKKEGFVIVVDSEAANKIHHFSCSLVQKPNYMTKVVEKQNKTAKFFWVDSAEEATGDLKAELCMNCIAPMRDFLF